MLIRNINPTEHVYLDENTGGRRLKSAAFSASSGDPNYGMSVDLGQVLQEAGHPDDHKVPPGMAAVKLRVADVRALDLSVGSDPVPTNEFHGQVWGVKSGKRKNVQKAVLGWVKPIAGVSIR